MLSRETMDIILQTVPFLESRGEALTCHFYRRLFGQHPELRAWFNPAHQGNGSQPRALAGAVCAYARHIEDPSALAGAVELIAQKHASLGVLPEHYPVVGEHLLASIQELLGDDCTPEILDAWAQAYGVLASIFVAREGEIYGGQGWSGFKPFVIERKVKECEGISSFYLRPQDGEVQAHLPGQYLTVRVPHPETGTTMRNYSISIAPGEDHYRISVQREGASAVDMPEGYVSHRLHEVVAEGGIVEVGPPCGEFTLDTTLPWERPLTLIAGGIGVTPLMAMAHAVSRDQPERPIYFIHGSRGLAAHAFREEIASLARRNPKLNVHIRYEAGEAGAGGCQSIGLLDRALISDFAPLDASEVYVCGPAPMMHAVLEMLAAEGVAPERQHHEFFGPAGAPQGEEEASAPV